MKLFMEAVWSAAGKEVTGNYWGTPFLGNNRQGRFPATLIRHGGIGAG